VTFVPKASFVFFRFAEREREKERNWREEIIHEAETATQRKKKGGQGKNANVGK